MQITFYILCGLTGVSIVITGLTLYYFDFLALIREIRSVRNLEQQWNTKVDAKQQTTSRSSATRTAPLAEHLPKIEKLEAAQEPEVFTGTMKLDHVPGEARTLVLTCDSEFLKAQTTSNLRETVFLDERIQDERKTSFLTKNSELQAEENDFPSYIEKLVRGETPLLDEDGEAYTGTLLLETDPDEILTVPLTEDTIFSSVLNDFDSLFQDSGETALLEEAEEPGRFTKLLTQY